MRDQAFQLRNLALRTARERSSAEGPAPRLIVVTGGKGGVGATTLGVNLAVALAQQGARVVLVDADLYCADVAALCGLTERGSVRDVLASRRDIHEVLERGPAGIQVAPGGWASGDVAPWSKLAQQRLLTQLKALRRHADIVLLDVGSGPSEVARRFWKAADDVLLVTTPDPVAVMDAYATIKTMAAGAEGVSIHVVVNQAVSDEVAADVHQRVDQSCRKFLGVRVGRLGRVPPDPLAASAAQGASPLRVAQPNSPASQAIGRLAAALAAESPDARRTTHAAG